MPLNIKDLTVSSPDIAPLGPIDPRFTLEDGNQVPRISITGVPEGTVEVALICHDPDAPLPNGFTHWVLYGLPAHDVELGPDADAVYRPGPNGAGLTRWAGPQPPARHGLHHYYFWAYALDTVVEGTPNREEFLATYGENVIEQNRLVGVFSNEG
ncbi:YbhB/YbcL family Raf kinase inhibitor-like protein [Microbacterium sp. MEC084]|uniref:YbhB/YbcL family Raf kinase inhibitor-like protein n=1 Tax=Microbacterium sp. MEC084 TaxID=1963027 RepID=UPI00106F2BF9|nr:YbhB/YbcL family Raf kinase inhibitor-like protein [Microbacterium sp. MEC084]MCD1269941.1 YbhB/YbcL family Raf kinase inhibitor-like protein [Microbacterium sp. MEC084]